jgi:hypothetical protein
MPPNDHHIWRLEIGGVKYVGLIPHDLTYFQSHFNGRPMASDWVPPPTKLLGKSKKLADFVSWMKCAPVVSERAMRVLEPALQGCVQFFPFHEIKGRNYFAMNVICVDRRLLDKARSKILYVGDENDHAIAVREATFIDPLPPKLPPIFKISLAGGNVLGDIYVTRAFAEVAIGHKLTGIALSDPSQSPMKLALNAQPLNVVPGIVN